MSAPGATQDDPGRSRGALPPDRRPLADTPLADLSLADLPLGDLRGYRQRLRAEEDRASYWRRLVHARIDLVVAQRGAVASMSLPELVRVLGDTGSGVSRRALLGVHAGEPLPDLPDLEQVWATPHGEDEAAEVLERLRRAEAQLAAYRTALLRRLDECTALLVRRYRENPAAALEVLG